MMHQLRSEFFRLSRSAFLIGTMIVLIVADIFLSSRCEVNSSNLYSLPDLCTMSEFTSFAETSNMSPESAIKFFQKRGQLEESSATDLIGETGMSFSAFDRTPDYEPWIDFSIPIYNPDDPTRDYWIAGVTAGRNSSPRNWKRVRFGANVVSMPNYVFIYNSVIDEIEGFGKIRVTDLPGNFFDNSGNGSPLKNRVYEGTDFYPEALKSIGGFAFRDAPSLKGTIRVGLNRLSNINDLIARSEAVTNWIFTAEDLPTLNIISTMFKPTTVTIAATNPVTTTDATFYYSGDGLKDLIFLAHAPSVASMDLFLTGQSSGSTVIHACKWAPGWKELRMKNPSSCAEWEARPADCWGIYQTANGKKRFFLVRQESKYGPEPGLAVIIR